MNCGGTASPLARLLSTGGLAVEKQGTKRALSPQLRDRATVVHGCPPVIHRLSPGFLPSMWREWRGSPTTCPQNLQHVVHTRAIGRGQSCYPPYTSTAVSPGVVHRLWVTPRKNTRGCPPTVDTGCGRLWMDVESRLSAKSCGRASVRPPTPGDGGSIARGAGQEFCLIRLVSSAIWL